MPCIDPQCDCHPEMAEMYARGQVRRALEGLPLMAQMRVLHDITVESVQGFDD